MEQKSLTEFDVPEAFQVVSKMSVDVAACRKQITWSSTRSLGNDDPLG